MPPQARSPTTSRRDTIWIFPGPSVVQGWLQLQAEEEEGGVGLLEECGWGVWEWVWEVEEEEEGEGEATH